MLSHVRLCDLWTVNLQAPLSTEFSRQAYWIQLPFSSPGTLPNPGTDLTSTLTGEFFATEAPAKLPNKNKQVYVELVCIAEESDTTTHLRVKHWAHVGMGMISGEKTGRLSSLEIVMSWRQVDRAVLPCDCLEEQIWHYLSTAKGKVGKEEGVRY